MATPGGGGTIVDTLLPLTTIPSMRQIRENRHCSFMRNYARGIQGINETSVLQRNDPIEHMVVTTEKPDDHNYITVTRYPELPYWNRRFSHPIIEELSTFDWSMPGASHLFWMFSNIIIHMINEDTSTAKNGYWMSHSAIAYTY